VPPGGLVRETATSGGVSVTSSDPLGEQPRATAAEETGTSDQGQQYGPQESVLDEWFAGRPVNRDDVLLLGTLGMLALLTYTAMEDGKL